MTRFVYYTTSMFSGLDIIHKCHKVSTPDVSHDFRLMGATFERRLNQSVDRNAETDVRG